jgi:NitT/TauT family transport system substrate-binding protein
MQVRNLSPKGSGDLDKNEAIALSVIIIVVLSIGFIAVWNPVPAPDVRIGYLQKDLHQLALRVAIENGLFAQEGINIELVQYSNGAAEMDGFLAGQIDMGYLGVAPAMVKSINQNIPITVLAAVNLEGSAIEVSKEEYDAGHVTAIADLVGKGVYQPGPSTVQNFLLRLALNESGLSYDNITGLTTSPSLMADSLSATNPAFIAWEPFNAKAEYDNKTVPLLLSGEIWPRHPCCVVASDNSFLASHPDIVQKVLNIHVEAENWILNHTEEAIAIATSWLEMDSTPVLNGFNRIIYDYRVNRTGFEIYLNFLIRESQIEPAKIPANTSAFLDGFINTTYIDSLP